MTDSGLFSSTKSFSWGEPGQGVGIGFRNAIVLKVGEAVQATEYNRDQNAPKKPAFFPSGDPKMQIPVTVLTDLRDPAIPGDNGWRVVYLTQGDGRFKTTRGLMRQAGRNGDPQKGDVWSLVCTVEDMANRGKKDYQGEYRQGDGQTIAAADRALNGTAAPADSGVFAGQVHDTQPATTSFAPPAAAPAETPEQELARLRAALAGQPQAGQRPGYDPAPAGGQPAGVGAGAANGGGFFPF